jgi:ubiquinone/menaquinone biosynthesis C-methylase UbiE
LFKCPTEVLEIDLIKTPHQAIYNGIVSSMTIHHIQNIREMLKIMYNLLSKDGFIALADLDKEDGTFHNDNNGVYHYGFNRKELEKIATDVGFKDIEFNTVNIIKKPHRDFSVFLMIAKR